MNGALGPGGFLLGALLLTLTLGCAVRSAALIVARRFDHLSGAPRAVAHAVLTIAAVIGANLLPLALGVLTRVTVPLSAGLILLAASRIRASPDEATPAATEERGTGERARASWLLAAIGLLATAVAWIAHLELSAPEHVTSIDALAFHLPGAIRFIQSGSLWQTTQYLPGQAQGNYPQYGDVLLMSVVLPWHSLAFVRYVNPPLLALAALATYGIARELRAPAPTAILVALALFVIRPTLFPALRYVLTDPLFLACFSAGVLFLLRHWRTRSRGDLVLAGIGLGIALGTKWYGLTDIPVLLVSWAVVSVVSGRPRSALARDVGLIVGVIALAGGVWLARNLILTGNPVFDYKVTLLGATIFPAPPDPLRSRIGLTLAHYVGDLRVLRHYVWPVFRSDFGLIGALISAGALTAGVLTARRRHRDTRVAILLAGAILAAIAYAITPYSAQGVAGAPVLIRANTRYGAPALILAAPLLALAIGRLRRGRLIAELTLLVCVIVDLQNYLPASRGRELTTAVAILLVAAAMSPVRRTIRAGWPGRLRSARPAVALAVLGCGAAAFAYHYQRLLADRPYVPSDATIEYILAHAPAHTTIGLAGSWTTAGLIPVAPLFGPRLQNTVSYVGPFVAHRLEPYAAPGPFIAALTSRRYALLEVGTGFPPAPDPLLARWARRAGYREVARSARLILMRAPGSG